MITLTDTKFGTKRKAIIGGLNTFDVLAKSLNVVFYVQLIDNQGNLLDDLSINQNRKVVYNVNMDNWVDAQFNKVNEGTPNAKTEYDFFWELLQTTPLPTLVLQLSEKLKQRGIFD
jgi:hypothetical protein